MNPAAEALTQWSAAEVGGLPVDEVLRFVESDSGRRVDSPSREALLTGASAHLPPGIVAVVDGMARSTRWRTSARRCATRTEPWSAPCWWCAAWPRSGR